MQTVAKTTAANKYSEDQITKSAAQVWAIARYVQGTKQQKLDFGKRILAAVIRASSHDLDSHNDVSKIILKQAGKDVLHSAASGTWTNNVPPTTNSKMPGDSSIGNNPIQDKTIEPSQYSKQYCTDKLTAAGVTDQDVIGEICASWNGAVPPEAGQNKSASINPDSNGGKPAWLIAREKLFNGGPEVAYPKKRFETVDKMQSKSAAVIANQDEVPNYIKNSFVWRAHNAPEEPKQQQQKNASIHKDTKPAWLIAREHLFSGGRL